MDDRDPGPDIARRLVTERFPQVRAAWLGGSVARGDATSTSDLDITVLLDGAPAPYRESLVCARWPVELFVHTEESIGHYVAKDVERRRNTMPSLLTEMLLIDVDGAGERLSAMARQTIEAGPRPLTEDELRLRRYSLTDMLDDLADVRTPPERVAIATALWTGALDLFLVGQQRWTGGGKWLVRHVEQADPAYAGESVAALDAAIHSGETAPLVRLVDATLSAHGGRLWAGFRAGGESRPAELSVHRRIEHWHNPDAPAPNSLVPASNLLVVDESCRILLQRRRDTGQWALPGGKQELGETPAGCAVRECLEETGVKAEVTGLLGVYSDPHHLIEYTSDGEVRQEYEVTYLGRPVGGEPTVNEEASAVEWVAVQSLDAYDIHPTMRRQIDDHVLG